MYVHNVLTTDTTDIIVNHDMTSEGVIRQNMEEIVGSHYPICMFEYFQRTDYRFRLKAETGTDVF